MEGKEYIKMRNNYDGIWKSTSPAHIFKSNEVQ